MILQYDKMISLYWEKVSTYWERISQYKEMSGLPSFSGLFEFSNCSIRIISLTPRFNAVNLEHAKENRLNGFLSLHTFPHPAEAGC
jgi:hypothetical protein